MGVGSCICLDTCELSTLKDDDLQRRDKEGINFAS